MYLYTYIYIHVLWIHHFNLLVEFHAWFHHPLLAQETLASLPQSLLASNAWFPGDLRKMVGDLSNTLGNFINNDMHLS